MRSLPLLTVSYVLLLPIVSTAQHGQPAQSQPPPAELDVGEKRGSAVEVSYEGLHGSVTYAMAEKLVRFYWRRDFSDYLPEVASPPQLSIDGLFTSIQEENSVFWPTEVCGFGENRICVAGKAAIGTTRIQIWTLAADADLGTPYVDNNGVVQYPRNSISIQAKSTIYEGDQAGKRLVRALLRNHGSPVDLFVQFHDSSDLYRLNSSTGQLTLVLAATQEPLLQSGFIDRWSAHHSLGYMYNLIAPGALGTLVLFDVDLDGVLDLGSTRRLVGDEWYAGPTDFSNSAGYVKIY